MAIFNDKINLGVEGRAKTFRVLNSGISKSSKKIWFHCASLGEYEQGLPVFKAIRKHYKEHQIILSFFSPSGYQIRKNNPVADFTVYLPIDTNKNAARFLNLVNPELTIFVKYEIWPNFLKELKKRDLRALLISAVFRENQPYFKFYGKIFKESLLAFEHIFTQDRTSKNLLESIGIMNATVSGDTRFDRVSMQFQQDNSLEFVEIFKSNSICLVAGSTWPEDDDIICNYINNNQIENLKFIIAPHNIKSAQLDNLISCTNKKTVLFSNKSNEELKKSDVLILDTIGILSKVYAYADIVYVGGAMGKTGLHNTLEPAVFGTPIIVGPNHQKFPEAQAMIDNGGMKSVENQKEFNEILDRLFKDEVLRQKTGKLNKVFVEKNKGAVIQILNYLRIYKNFK